MASGLGVSSGSGVSAEVSGSGSGTQDQGSGSVLQVRGWVWGLGAQGLIQGQGLRVSSGIRAGGQLGGGVSRVEGLGLNVWGRGPGVEGPGLGLVVKALCSLQVRGLFWRFGVGICSGGWVSGSALGLGVSG